MAKKKDSKQKLERTYTIPLRKCFVNAAVSKRTPRAVRGVRVFLKKHMKAENIKLGFHLNEYLWRYGIKNPPHHIRVNAVKEDDVVKAELYGFEFKGAVKAQPKKKEPETMKDKLATKLGANQEAAPEKKPGKKEEEKKEEKKEEEKTQPQKEEAAKKQEKTQEKSSDKNPSDEYKEKKEKQEKISGKKEENQK